MNFPIDFSLQFFVILVANCLEARLTVEGNHTCLVPETYKQYTMVGRDVIKPKKESYFCWDVTNFFKCSKTVYVTERVYENTPVTRTRFVAKCCTGYIKSTSGSCIPLCWPLCRNGNCTAPNECTCFAGYHGADCLQRCPPNHWGPYCSEECQCMNDAKCDFETGNCSCQPGWRGTRCELFCEDGYYGINCQQKCNCSAQKCDSQTGRCISTTTESILTTNSTRNQSSNFEILEESTTIAVVKTTTPSLFTESSYTTKNYLYQEKSTTMSNTDETVTYDFSTIKYEEESSTAATAATAATVDDDEIETKTNSEFSTPATQPNTVKLEPGTTTEVADEVKVSFEGTTSTEETSHAVEILKNLESDRRNNNNNNNNNNASDFVESENEENEIKFTDETEKNYTSEIRKNDLIEKTTPGEYVTDFSNEIEMENDGDGRGNKKYANEREINAYSFQFMPSVMVLLGVSIVIIVIGARWLIANHRKRKFKIAKVKEDKMFNPGNLKYTESVYTANSFFEEPITMTDLNLNTKEPPPVLLTFKPDNT